MRVFGISSASPRPNGLTSRQPDRADTEPAAPGRTLVALGPVAAPDNRSGHMRRQSAFLAQLIAGRDQHAQARERRRAEPAVALAAYRATAKLSHQI